MGQEGGGTAGGGNYFFFVDNCPGIFGVCGIREVCLDAEGEDGRVSGWGED